MGQAASPSLYDYAGGDPVNLFDPTGRADQPADSLSNSPPVPNRNAVTQNATTPVNGGQNPSAPTVGGSGNSTSVNVKVYVFTDTPHGNDYESTMLNLSLSGIANFDPVNTYTVIPVGTQDPAPPPGANTYVVTHQNLVPNNDQINDLLSIPIVGSLLGNIMGLTDVGVHYNGTVLVPDALDTTNTMSTAKFDSIYGASQTRYCGKGGSGPLLPSTAALSIASIYMTPDQVDAYINSQFGPGWPFLTQ